MKHKIIQDIIICLMVVALIALVRYGKHNENKLLASDAESYNEWSAEKVDYLSPNSSSKTQFYKKIDNTEDLNALIIDDNFLLSTSKFNDNFKDWINSYYNVDINIKPLSDHAINIQDSTKAINSMTDEFNYDLVIISCRITNADDFIQTYNNLVCSIKNKNYNCSIIAVIPPIENKNTQYSTILKSYLTDNNIDSVDLSTKFNTNNNMILNGSPTELGYGSIQSSIEDIIKGKVN